MTSPLSASHSAVLSSTSVTTSVVSSPGRGRHECPRKLRLRLRWYSSSTAPPTNTHARNASTEPRIALTYLVALPLPSPPGRAATSSGTAASTMPSAARYEARTASGVPALSRKAAASAANAAVTVAWPAPSASLLPFVTRARMSSSPRRMRSSLAAFGCSASMGGGRLERGPLASVMAVQGCPEPNTLQCSASTTSLSSLSRESSLACHAAMWCPCMQPCRCCL
eukprot:356690-Chlamydomonas_euryale.AAC.22